MSEVKLNIAPRSLWRIRTGSGSDLVSRHGKNKHSIMPTFEFNEVPLGYFVTCRAFGTWLHGDERGSVDRKHNRYGTPRIPANEQWQIQPAHSESSTCQTRSTKKSRRPGRHTRDLQQEKLALPNCQCTHQPRPCGSDSPVFQTGVGSCGFEGECNAQASGSRMLVKRQDPLGRQG